MGAVIIDRQYQSSVHATHDMASDEQPRADLGELPGVEDSQTGACSFPEMSQALHCPQKSSYPSEIRPKWRKRHSMLRLGRFPPSVAITWMVHFLLWFAQIDICNSLGFSGMPLKVR